MNSNPYQTPSSNLETSNDLFEFYVVSIRKFTVLFFATLGVYVIYWFFRNWKEYRASSGERVWPIPRAIFNIFFTHSLFSAVQNSLSRKNINFQWSPGRFATVYVIAAIISNVLDRMSMREIGFPYTELFSIIVLLIIYLTLIKPQKAINLSQGDSEGQSNNSFSFANIVWISLGLVLWALSIYGLVAALGIINPR